MSRPALQLKDQTFGYWKVEDRGGKAGYWRCRCKCGNVQEVRGSSLTQGTSESCGCPKRKHGYSSKNSTPVQKHIYSCWRSMKARCKSDPDLEYEARWADFSVYLADILEWIGEPPARALTVDRIDNGRGYFPGNIRWATANMQGSNKKASVLIWLKYWSGSRWQYRSGTLPEWSRYLSRIDSSWTVEKLSALLKWMTLEEIFNGVHPAWLIPNNLAQHEMDAALEEQSESGSAHCHRSDAAHCAATKELISTS